MDREQFPRDQRLPNQYQQQRLVSSQTIQKVYLVLTVAHGRGDRGTEAIAGMDHRIDDPDRGIGLGPISMRSWH